MVECHTTDKDEFESHWQQCLVLEQDTFTPLACYWLLSIRKWLQLEMAENC